MTCWKLPWGALLMPMAIVADVCSPTQPMTFAEEDAKKEGGVIQISPDAGEPEPLPKGEVAAEPTYWIGIQGREVQSPVLRTHLQLAEEMGVVIEEVFKESPAEKAGLKKHDIVLRANGNAVHGMEVLWEQVHEHREKPIELRVIRLGKEETVVVVPEERPQHLSASDDLSPRPRLARRFGGGTKANALRQLIEKLQRDGSLHAGVRIFGPGIVLDDNAFYQNAMPDGVSLSVTLKNGEPAKVTIKRGEESWEIVGNDPEALQQLPEDLRPMVERVLPPGQSGTFRSMQLDITKGLEELLPRISGDYGGSWISAPPTKPWQREMELSERLERMENDLRKLQERLSEKEPEIVDELPAD